MMMDFIENINDSNLVAVRHTIIDRSMDQTVVITSSTFYCTNLDCRSKDSEDILQDDIP